MWVSQVTKVTCLLYPVGISRHYLCILDYNHPRKTLTQTCTRSHTLDAALINGLWSFTDATPGKPVNMLYEARACYCYLLLCSLHGSTLLTSRLLCLKKMILTILGEVFWLPSDLLPTATSMGTQLVLLLISPRSTIIINFKQ